MAADRPTGEDLGDGEEVVGELVADPGEAKCERTEADVDEGARELPMVEVDPVDESSRGRPGLRGSARKRRRVPALIRGRDTPRLAKW